MSHKNLWTLSFYVPLTFLSLAASVSFFLWLRNAFLTPSSNSRLISAKKLGKIASVFDIPGPIGLPFVGVILDVIPFLRRKRMDLYTDHLNEKYDGLCRLPRKHHFICVDDAAVAKRLLTCSDFIRNDVFSKISYDIAPYALLVLPSGEQWKRHRKGLQPAFGLSHVKEAFDISLQSIDSLLNIWRTNIRNGNNTRDVVEDFTMLTADIIAHIAFQIDLGGVKSLETKTALEFYRHTEKLAETIQRRIGFRFTPFLWGLLGISSEQVKPSTGFLRSMLQNIIDDKKKAIKSRNKARKNHKMEYNFLDRLLSSGFSDEEMKSEALGFFLAGHDTTATTLSWSLLALVQYHDIYSKLRSEIDNVLRGEKPTSANITSLRYLDAFNKETQRVYGVVIAILRDSGTDTTITTSDGLTIAIPANVQFLINMHRIQMSEKYWGADAKHFKPDRWLNDFTPVPGSFMPFGDGPMNCIGQKIANLEIKIALIRIIQCFELKLSARQEKIEPVTTITYGLKNAICEQRTFSKHVTFHRSGLGTDERLLQGSVSRTIVDFNNVKI
ncbi:hypothetical protein HK098_003598 [Nowakowskiella sp. JEL0407]|nr:hypothetical protein HK098_003598 [Nowakowskiella sp. JEL0407]